MIGRFCERVPRQGMPRRFFCAPESSSRAFPDGRGSNPVEAEEDPEEQQEYDGTYEAFP